MPKLIDLTKRLFPALRVLSRVGTHPTRKCPTWLCRCSCGTEFTACGTDLQVCDVTSCGCRKKEHARKLKYRHGLEGSAEYSIWLDVKQRCTNRKRKGFKNYGGRGITLDPVWRDFAVFYRDMGPRPTKKHSIERRDNNSGYSSNNCYWATRKEQSRNRRSNRMLTFEGQTRCLQEWSELKGLSRDCLRDRLKRGWTVAEALSTPTMRCGAKRPKKGCALC